MKWIQKQIYTIENMVFSLIKTYIQCVKEKQYAISFLREQTRDFSTDSVYYFGNIRAPLLFLVGIQDKIAISPVVTTVFYEIQRENSGVPSVLKSFDFILRIMFTFQR